jgi:hypothetical protein
MQSSTAFASVIIVLLLVQPAQAGEGDAFSSLEQEIASEVNLARSGPARYAEFLEQWKEYYRGKRIERPGKPTILTEEGVVPVEGAMVFLQSVGHRPVLRMSVGMARAAKDHARELGASGALGHRGRDGSWPTTRLNRYGAWREAVGEAIYYGSGTAREIVMSLIIDDGVRGRDHRRNLFDATFHVLGVGCAPHIIYGTMCVLDFAGGYIESH